MVYQFNINNSFNIVTYPKHGCTQITQWAAECRGKGIDYEQHRCQGAHSWARTMAGTWNPENITYVVYREPWERALSHYLSNYEYSIHQRHRPYRNLSFSEYVESIANIMKLDAHHLRPFSPAVRGLIQNGSITKLKLLNLKSLNEFSKEKAAELGVPSLRGKTINNSSWDYFLYSDAMKAAGYPAYNKEDYFNLKYLSFHGKARANEVDKGLLKNLKQKILQKDKISKADVLRMSTEVQKIVKASMPEGFYLTDRDKFFNQNIIEHINQVYKEDINFIKENSLL